MKKSFKKIISLIICLAMVLTIAPLSGLLPFVSAVSGTCGSNLKWSLDTSTGVLNIYGEGNMTNWSSPYDVPWRSDRSYIKTVKIGYGVTSIGNDAFYYCTKLTSITIPDSVTRICDDAFYDTGYYNDNSNWTDGVLYIGSHLIDAKTTISGAYTIKSGTKTIADSAFYNCTKLTSITIPDSVTSIGSSAFNSCDRLTSITIPDSVTSISSSAFAYCESLKSVTIPDLVTSIGSSAFYNCDRLTSITIPDSVTSIGSSAFYNCDRLTSITIPDSVISIGDRAFYDCDSLETATLSNYITSIPQYLFSDCDSLTDIKLGRYVTNIGDSAFYSCGSLTEINLPEALISIGTDTFASCDSLTTVVIPKSVNAVGICAFSSCASLAKFEVASDNEYFSNDIFGVLFNKDKTELIQFPKGSNETKYTVPDSVISVGDYAFYSCEDLTSLRLGTAVKSVGNYGVACCYSLTSVAMPDTLESIGRYAFAYCTGLTGVIIKSSVTSIGSYAFNACSNLARVTMDKSVTNIGNSAFYDCTLLKKVYYSGNAEDWGAMTIGSSNTALTGATKYYEYELEYTAIEIKATTCTEDGIISYVNELGDSYTEIVSALGHKYELLRRVEPTCTKKGTEVHKCKTCNKINTIQINVTEHTYGVDGLCTVCDKIRDIATPEKATTIIDREKNLISGLGEYLDVDSLMNYITVSDDTSIEIDRDIIGTGTKIKVIDKATSEIIEEYTIVIFGDYNGDGVADIEDTGYFASISNFEIFDYFEHEHLFMAADVNGDGVVDSMDEEDMYAVANFEAYIDHTITSGSKVVRY